ncbi:hypothetical protein ABW21_db0204575 [Orbilia brochopaga]|nr:hypothetical protein ABW21_db0204575 [Drechslerella brochopaga]
MAGTFLEGPLSVASLPRVYKQEPGRHHLRLPVLLQPLGLCSPYFWERHARAKAVDQACRARVHRPLPITAGTRRNAKLRNGISHPFLPSQLHQTASKSRDF